MPTKVAVITRTKNRPLLLPRCIQSVLHQSCEDWLHVIVNDGGDSATVESVVSRFSGQYRGRLRVIHNPTPVGMQNASNLAIRSSESEFIAIHDDDDTWNPRFLEECVRHLEAAGPDSREQGVATQSFWIMEEIDSWGSVVELSRQDFLPFESVSLFQLAARNQFPPIAFLYRRKAHEKIGCFEQAFNELGDHDFNLRFLAQYDIGVIPKRLAGYHWRRQSHGSSYGNTVTDGVASHRKMLVRMQNHYLREDLAKQRVGLGFLLNISSALELQKEKTQNLSNKTDRMSGLLNHVAGQLDNYRKKIARLFEPWKVKWPRPVYDQLTDWMTTRANQPLALHAGNGHAPIGFSSETKTFPPLLVRKRADVFLYIQDDVRRLLNRPSLGFAAARVASGEECEKEPGSPGAENANTLDEIYAVLRERLDCDEAAAAQIKQLELQAERKLRYEPPRSAQPDRELNGASGGAAGRFTCPVLQMPLVDQHTSLSGAWENDLASSLYTGLVRRRRSRHPLEDAQGPAFWEMLGYEVMGPLHHSLISWVISRASKLGLKKIFFLARDGFQLAKEFELFREKLGLDIKGEYLFASRRLWNVARMERLDEESMAFLAAANPMMRVRDFLARVGLDPALHETLARQCGFKGLDERVTTELGRFKSETLHQNMRQLFRKLERPILEQARQDRERLLDYFAKVGLLEEGVGIVDVGWAASSARALQLILASAGKRRPVPAFYFGTWETALPVAEAGCPIESFFMNFGQPAHRASILAESVELIEAFFSAPHPTIIGLEEKNGNWEPVHGEPELDAPTEAALETAARTAFEFIRDALELWPEAQEVEPAFGYLETVLERLLRFPQPSEAAALGRFSWRNTFGGSGPLRHLANPPATWQRLSRKRALQEAYDQCYWKRGFLAQLSPRAKKYVKV